MQIGVNYPWFDYGWDFGLGPPAWRGDRVVPRWYDAIDAHLRRFHDLGIDVVRWFVLADGLTYGTGSVAPVPDADPTRGWRFEPPPIGAEVLEHFDELLYRFASFNVGFRRPIRLLPVLIDFHFCDPGVECRPNADASVQPGSAADRGWVKQGRADAITDSVKRQWFLDGALEPLLDVSRRRPDVIHAWELVNEPEWVTNGWHPDRRRNHPVDAPSMRAFLEEGTGRIRRAGFKSTIGFARIETLGVSDVTADIDQFHHYPAGRVALPDRTSRAAAPVIIGEFATTTRDVWPDLPRGSQGVLSRLRHAAALGYTMAIPWSFLGHDRCTEWSAEVERDLMAFAEERGATESAR